MDMDFIYNCCNPNLRPKTWFKITAHPYLKGILQVKYESVWAKGKEDMLQTRNTDGQTDHYTVGPLGIIVNLLLYFFFGRLKQFKRQRNTKQNVVREFFLYTSV